MRSDKPTGASDRRILCHASPSPQILDPSPSASLSVCSTGAEEGGPAFPMPKFPHAGLKGWRNGGPRRSGVSMVRGITRGCCERLFRVCTKDTAHAAHPRPSPPQSTWFQCGPENQGRALGKEPIPLRPVRYLTACLVRSHLRLGRRAAGRVKPCKLWGAAAQRLNTAWSDSQRAVLNQAPDATQCIRLTSQVSVVGSWCHRR